MQSSLLSEAYKTQADLEVQLNVAKSNLQLVIANNEMLEDALKRDTSGQSKDVGWRRTSGRDSGIAEPRASLERSQSVDYPVDSSPPPSAAQDNRFLAVRRLPTRHRVPRAGQNPPAARLKCII